MLLYAGVVAFYLVLRLPLGGFTIGLMTGMVPFAIYVPLLVHTYPETMGVWAEDWTDQEFSKLGWRCVRNLNFERCDVDAVVATPARLLAVETKWRMGKRDSEAARRRHADDLRKTTRAARKVRSVMLSSPDRLDVPVTAVLLIWGVTSDVQTGYDSSSEVYVLDGNEPGGWPSELAAGPCDPRIPQAFLKAERFADKFSRRDTTVALTRSLAREVRRGWRERSPRRRAKATAA